MRSMGGEGFNATLPGGESCLPSGVRFMIRRVAAMQQSRGGEGGDPIRNVVRSLNGRGSVDLVRTSTVLPLGRDLTEPRPLGSGHLRE